MSSGMRQQQANNPNVTKELASDLAWLIAGFISEFGFISANESKLIN